MGLLLAARRRRHQPRHQRLQHRRRPARGAVRRRVRRIPRHLRDVYPDAYHLILAPSLWGDEVALVAGYLQKVVDQRHAAGDPDVDFADINVQWIGAGCDGHPSAATHEGMAMRLTDELKAHLGW